MTDIVSILVKVTPEHKKLFDQVAQDLRLSKSEIFRLLIEFLDKQDDNSELMRFIEARGQVRNVSNRMQQP